MNFLQQKAAFLSVWKCTMEQILIQKEKKEKDLVPSGHVLLWVGQPSRTELQPWGWGARGHIWITLPGFPLQFIFENNIILICMLP